MRKPVFLLAFMCISLFFGPTVSRATIQVMHVGSLPFRTINVDGDPSDWAGIPTLVFDGGGDSPPEEDIVAVYGANDDDFLYFLMEFNEVEISASVPVNDNDYTVCRFFIDIIPGGSSSSRDADFRIGFKTHILSVDTQIPLDVAVLEYYVPSSWLLSDCSDVHGESMGRFVEVAVAWDCIGGRKCFNSYFTASAQVNTDYAPDEGAEHLLIGCCPGEPPAVGGRLLPLNNVYELLRWITIPIILLSITTIYKTYLKKTSVRT